MTDEDGLDLLWCPFPDRDSAVAAATLLVDERLAACVQVMSPVHSVYHWQGATQRSTEVPILCKIGKGQAAVAARRIAAVHPHDLPAISWWSAGCGRALADWAAGH